MTCVLVKLTIDKVVLRARDDFPMPQEGNAQGSGVLRRLLAAIGAR